MKENSQIPCKRPNLCVILLEYTKRGPQKHRGIQKISVTLGYPTTKRPRDAMCFTTGPIAQRRLLEGAAQLHEPHLGALQQRRLSEGAGGVGSLGRRGGLYQRLDARKPLEKPLVGGVSGEMRRRLRRSWVSHLGLGRNRGFCGVKVGPTPQTPKDQWRNVPTHFSPTRS